MTHGLEGRCSIQLSYWDKCIHFFMTTYIILENMTGSVNGCCKNFFIRAFVWSEDPKSNIPVDSFLKHRYDML